MKLEERIKLLKLDEAIAVLRGEEVHHVSAPYSGRTCTCGITISAFQGGPHPCDNKNKLYSSDIRYAMELWDEMKAKRTGSASIICYGGMVEAAVTINGKHYTGEAETEAHAIAGAYYKWKSEEVVG